MTYIRFLKYASVAVLSGCATTSTIRMDDVAGTWYGSAPQPENSSYPIHWLLNIERDGKFSAEMFEERSCGLKRFTSEAGRWAMSNGLFTEITTQVDGRPTEVTDRYFHDVYEIVVMTHDTMTYRSIVFDNTFTSRRVRRDYVPSMGICPDETPGRDSI